MGRPPPAFAVQVQGLGSPTFSRLCRADLGFANAVMDGRLDMGKLCPQTVHLDLVLVLQCLVPVGEGIAVCSCRVRERERVD